MLLLKFAECDGERNQNDQKTRMQTRLLNKLKI